MSICQYCGQKAGWFSDAHESCIQKSNQGIDALKACMATAVAQGKQYGEIRAQLDKIAADAFVPQQQALGAIKEGWSQAAEKHGMAQPLNEQEGSAIWDIGKAAGLTQDDLLKTAGGRAVFLSWRLWMVLNNQIEPFKGPISFNLQAEEIPVFGLANVLLSEEQTGSTYVGGYSGVSIRVASGLYYHFGGMRGHREQSTSLREVDYGNFLITTRAIYFGGTEKGVNFRLPYNQVVRFQPYSDAVGICKNGAKEKIFAPQQEPWACWFLFNVLQALAAKGSEVKLRATS